MIDVLPQLASQSGINPFDWVDGPSLGPFDNVLKSKVGMFLALAWAAQLWFIDAEGAVSGGVLDVPPDGDLTLVTEGDLEGVTTIALSVEPSGGSEQPTDVVFGGELS